MNLRERITKLLRSGNKEDADPDTLAQIATIDGVIARSSIPDNLLAYMVVDLAVERLDCYDKAYPSVFLSFEHAYVKFGSKAERPLIVEIYIPKGTKGVYLSLFTQNDSAEDDTEMLLQRGSVLRINGVSEIEVDGRCMPILGATLYQTAPKPPV